MTGAPPLVNLAGARPVIAVCGMAFEAKLASGPGVITLCGLGSERLPARLQQLLGQLGGQCRGIISFGTAGGLDPALRPGTCVIAEGIVTASEYLATDAGWLLALRERLPQATQGTLAGVAEPVLDAADKARLWQKTGASAVDMESYHAALVAHRHGLPFAACRVVVDPAHRSLPPAATAGLRGDGTIALMPVLRALATRPGQWPAFIRLASDAAAARQTLRSIRPRIGAAFAVPLHRDR